MSYRMALITGASSGIGAAMARALPLETGLLLAARDDSRLRALAAELAAPGRRIEIVVADLASALGRRAVQAFDRRRRPQAVLQLVAFNPMILPWRWPRRLASGLLRWWRWRSRQGASTR